MEVRMGLGVKMGWRRGWDGGENGHGHGDGDGMLCLHWELEGSSSNSLRLSKVFPCMALGNEGEAGLWAWGSTASLLWLLRCPEVHAFNFKHMSNPINLSALLERG